MSFAPPKTPKGTPRKLASTRPPSRASSPTKKDSSSSSLNTPSARPISRQSTQEAPRPTSRASQASQDGRTSPTKRSSVALAPTHNNHPSSSSLSSRQTSTSSLATTSKRLSKLALSTHTRDRTSDASTTASLSGFADESGAETETDCDLDVPRRRAGFGSLSGPGAAAAEETEDEAASFTSRGEGRRSSIVERDEDSEGTETEDHATRSGEEEAEKTETEEDEKDGKQENVVVCLRVRPPKVAPSQPIYFLTPASSSLSLAPSHPTLLKRGGRTTSSDEYHFKFDLLHVAPRPTVELYDRKIRPVVRAALGGFNGTVFAYGQTASGKTHTMMGSPEEPGIIPLAIDELFSCIHKQNDHRTYSLRVSFLEIYNEHLVDLLAPSPAPPSYKGPDVVDNGIVKNLAERAVSLPGEVLEVLREGEARRRVGQTDWNERSSRSHCVFVVTIESMSKTGGAARTSKLNLIDLAGSESATGQEDRRKEGAFINRSLLTLGTVIAKLTDPASSSSHIPYRDSKLTRLLQPALSGNSRVAVVCTVSPDAEQATETLSTLKFAKRAKMVVTKAERGVLVSDATLLKRYAAQVEELQRQIGAVEAASGADKARRERDDAAKRADEAERRGREAESALEATTAELASLRAKLAHTQSLILTGPSLEASARRVSGAGSPLAGVLSPSRTFSLSSRGVRGGMRSVSEMGGLGLGTPSRVVGMRRLPSAEARLAEEDEGREKEAALAAELATARAALADLESASAATSSELVTLRTQLQELQRSSSLARKELDKSAQAVEREEKRVGELETEVEGVRSDLLAAQQERDEAAAGRATAESERDAALARVAELEAALARLTAELASLRQSLSSSASEAATRAADLETTVETLKRRLAAQEEAQQRALEAKEKEQALVLARAEEAAARVKELEELAALTRQATETAELQSRRERQLELEKVMDERRAAVDEADQLRRQVERFEELERQRGAYRESQKAGTEALKSRLAEMQARTSGGGRELGRSTSSASAGSAVEDRSRHSSASSVSSASTAELTAAQTRAADLAARVAELEAQQSGEQEREVRATRERERERRELEKSAEVEAKRAGEWKEKYLEAQRRLDQLLGAAAASSNENQPVRPSFSSASSSSTTPRKPSPPPLSSASLRAPLAQSQGTSPATRPLLHSPQPSFSSSTSSGSTYPYPSWSKPTPPPLPYSPQQQQLREEKAARKLRRETIAKELERLKQHGGGRAVEEKKERGGWDSPRVGSPVKGTFAAGVQERGRKASWEA
ncbi:hypothetical protein JCM8097_004902 [Rhodosporidiobolus ruineniae]